MINADLIPVLPLGLVSFLQPSIHNCMQLKIIQPNDLQASNQIFSHGFISKIYYAKTEIHSLKRYI
jgi:hypothetical protein